MPRLGQLTRLMNSRVSATKLLAALSGLDADIIGLNELENSTGVEPLADIVAGLPGYAYIDTGAIGTDAIKVALIYQPDLVQPAGQLCHSRLLSLVDPNFLDTKNRPSLAQTFPERALKGDPHYRGGQPFQIQRLGLQRRGRSGCQMMARATANGTRTNQPPSPW